MRHGTSRHSVGCRSSPVAGAHALTTAILLDALRRATFGLDLRWRSPGDSFEVRRQPHFDRIDDAFRFDDAGEWLELQAQAHAAAAEVPQVRVRIIVPAAKLGAQAALAAANEVNRLGLAPVHYDAASASLVVQHAAVFTGFHDAAGLAPDPTLTFAQKEAALNMLGAALATADACRRALAPRAADDDPPLQRLDAAAPEVLEAFSVFVLSRMFRWEVASLAPGSPAHALLLEAATRCLVADTLDQREEDRADAAWRSEEMPAARSRVETWLGDRAGLDAAEAAYLDLVLFDVDRAARRQLRRFMADPPTAAPLRQFRLLDAALQQCGASWQGVRIADADVRTALAIGLDLQVAQVSAGFAGQLCKRHPFLAPPADAASTVIPERHWVTRAPVRPTTPRRK